VETSLHQLELDVDRTTFWGRTASCRKRHAALEFGAPNPLTVSQSGGDMKARTILLTLVLCCVGVAVCFAADAFTGTWKLNEAKSKLAPGAPKNNTVVYEAVGDNVKVTIDGTDKDGKPTHNEWTGKFDGKDYPVTGDPNTDARSYKKINARTLELTGKKDGKVVTTGRIAVSADGKTRTVTTSTTDSAGLKAKSTAVYDKQ
jgi:hypothetical protein